MKHNVLFFRGYGKVGNLVGYQIYGKQAFRAYNPVVRNPRTKRQMLQRAKLGLMTEISRIFLPASRLGFRDEAVGRGCSAVNYFVHKNIGGVTGTAADNVSIDPSRIICAQGGLTPVVFSSVIGTSTPGTITVAVTEINAEIGDASGEDKIYIFAYVPDAKMGILSSGVNRATGATVSLRYPESWSGLEVQVYGFVTGGVEATAGKSSNSEYIGHAELG